MVVERRNGRRIALWHMAHMSVSFLPGVAAVASSIMGPCLVLPSTVTPAQPVDRLQLFSGAGR